MTIPIQVRHLETTLHVGLHNDTNYIQAAAATVRRSGNFDSSSKWQDTDAFLVPSSLYSFSFAQNPGWSDTFATQDEILVSIIDFIITQKQESLS